MKVILYDLYGNIVQQMEGSEEVAEATCLALGLRWMEVEADATYSATTRCVVGGALVATQALNLPPITALVGEAVTIPMPAGANWAIDGSYYIGAKTLTFSTPGVRQAVPHGRWSGAVTVTVTTLADVKAALIAKIDDQNETRQGAISSPGTAKAYAYSRKAIEAEGSTGVLATVLNALSLTDRKKKYPFASAEMARTGETLSVVLTRYQAAYAASVASKAGIESAAIVAKAAVRAATTLAGVNAAANVNWPT